MYLAQTNLEVDTTVKFNFTTQNGDVVVVYKTKPGAFDPAIHRRRPSDQIVAADLYDRDGRDAEIYELTADRKKRLAAI